MQNFNKINVRNRFKLARLAMPVLSLITFWVVPARAQSNQPAAAVPAQPAQPTHSTHPRPQRQTLDDHVKALAKALDLNEMQQAAVKRILEQRQMETLRLRRDTSISGDERIARFRALQEQTVQRIRGVLNDEQKTKYDPLAVRNIAPAPDQKSFEDWMKATKPQ